MWIGINGWARAGKDSVADVLAAEYEFRRVMLAGPLKEMIYELNPYVLALTKRGTQPVRYQEYVDDVGLHEAKNNPEVRRLLQCFGTEVMRNKFGEDVWVDLAYSDKDPSAHYVVTDVRYRNEAEGIRDHDGFIIRVNRPGVGPANDHPSENEMTNYEFDYVLDNDGTLEDLAAVVHLMMDDLRNPVAVSDPDAWN